MNHPKPGRPRVGERVRDAVLIPAENYPALRALCAHLKQPKGVVIGELAARECKRLNLDLKQ